MILAETIFLDGVPLGQAHQDTNTQQIAFSPIKGNSRLPEREWASIDELKAAVIRAYRKEKSKRD